MAAISSIFRKRRSKRLRKCRRPARMAPHGPSKFRNFLGALGDALMVGGGGQPLYRQRMEEQRQQSALQGFLTNPDQAIAQLMQVDAPTGIALYRAVHPPSETPIGIKEYEYAKGNGYKGGYEDFVKLTHPALMSPVTLGANDTIEQPSDGALPHVTDQSSYDAVPPALNTRHPTATFGPREVRRRNRLATFR
jgi:hypothetical protein